MKTDSIFYRLFKTFPGIFFEAIGMPIIYANVYEFASVELKQTSFRIDGVFVPTDSESEEPVYFVEVQFQLDPDFYRRFFSEIFLYLRQNKAVKRWRAVVIYPQRSIESADIEPYQELLASPRVQRFYLDELGSAADTSLGLGMVKLIVETDQTAIDLARRLISQARQELEDDATKREILDLIETILVYKFTQISREELREMMILTESEFKQSRLYQEIKQEGLIEGKQEGRIEGKLEGKLETVPRLLERGFSVEEVAEILGLEVEQVRLIAPQ